MGSRGAEVEEALPSLLTHVETEDDQALKKKSFFDKLDEASISFDKIDPASFTNQEELIYQVRRDERKRWTAYQDELNRKQRAEELERLIAESRHQMKTSPLLPGSCQPANRYGEDAKFLPFDSTRHVPVLALINPMSGAMSGSDILAIARKMPYYKDRFFNIIDVVKDQRRGGLMDVFRIELNAAKEEAKALGTRCRIISGGGDGTASFALFLIFSALKADPSRAREGLKDTGNGFIWTDEELEQCFPALAQMPLGSANDFGNTLGWGQKFPGDRWGKCFGSREHATRELQKWIAAAVDPSSRIANFDIFGIMPAKGAEHCDFKLCELTGNRGWTPKVSVNGESRLVMKEAGLPVPFFVCLYFSAGFGAYMIARFQINRHKGPRSNKMEYVRQASRIVMEKTPSEMEVGLGGVEIECEDGAYFPPRMEKGQGGRKYREVGFLNINWQAHLLHGADRKSVCGRLTSSREPAKFNDGHIDMYRANFMSAVKNPGVRLQTDKKKEMTLTCKRSEGKGIFFQWDGEARFAFSPSGQPFSINVRKVLNVPVVLGPFYDPKVTGDFDNGEAVRFAFSGDTQDDVSAVRRRVLQSVNGELNAELNATMDEILAACHGRCE